MSVTAGVAAIKGTYAGEVSLSDKVAPSSLTMRASGAGAPGTIDADVKVQLAPSADGGTDLTYDADASVGGAIGGVGQRMLAGRHARRWPASSSPPSTATSPGCPRPVASCAGAAAGSGRRGARHPAPSTPGRAGDRERQRRLEPGQRRRLRARASLVGGLLALAGVALGGADSGGRR